MVEQNPTGYVIFTHKGASWRLWTDGSLHPVVRGGAGDDDGETLSVPDDLAEVTDEDLRGLHQRLEDRYQALRPEAASRDQIAELRSLREAQARIATTLTERATEAEEARQALAELDEVPALPEPAGDPQEPNSPAEQAPPAPTSQVPTPEPVAAAASAAAAGITAADIAANRTPQTPAQAQSQSATPRPRVAMLAAAGQQVVPYNSEVTPEALKEIVDATKHGLRPTPEAPRPRAYIASIPGFDETPNLGVELLSSRNSAEHNDRLIREAVDSWRARRWPDRYPLAQTAAICEPLDIIRDIPNISTDRDPFGASLPSRPAGRLGFQFTQPWSIEDTSAGIVTGWTDVEQELVDPDDPSTWKPCVHISCLSPQSVTASAVAACASFDVTTEMSSPEAVQNFMAKLDALRVRNRTIMLLGIVDNIASMNGGANTDTGIYGTWPAVVSAITRWLDKAVYQERLDVEEYTVYLPPGLVGSLVIDRASRAYVQDEERAARRAEAVQLLASITGVGEVVELLDDVTNPYGGAMANGVLPAEPSVNTLRLIPAAEALYFSTGQISTGIESDPQLARQNRRQWFEEEFVGLTRHGSSPWGTIDLTTCESGGRAGLITPAC